MKKEKEVIPVDKNQYFIEADLIIDYPKMGFQNGTQYLRALCMMAKELQGNPYFRQHLNRHRDRAYLATGPQVDKNQ